MTAKTKRDNGAGTIYQRENGTWRGRISVTQNGKRGFKYVSGKTEAEAKRKIREFQKQEISIDIGKITGTVYIIDSATGFVTEY